MKSFLHFCLFALAVGIFPSARADYSKLVLDEKPVAYWRFEERSGETISNSSTTGAKLNGIVAGKISSNQAGPQPTEFPDFQNDNSAVGFGRNNSFVRIKSSAENLLAFKLGDTITMEAWVKPGAFHDGQDIYIVGKGRTGNKGFAANNQNWDCGCVALRAKRI